VQSALAVDLSNGLVSYYKFNETSGTTASDSVGSNDGTANNARVFGTDGKIGKGADFTQGDDSINWVDVFGIESSDLYSFSGWFKIQGASSKQYLVKVGAGGGQSSIIRGYTGTSIEYYNGEGTGNRKTLISTPSTSVWYHVVIIKTSSTNLNFYINDDYVTNIVVSNQDLSILQLARYGTIGYANVLWDEVAIYNRALSVDEVSALYNSGTGYQPIFETNFSITAKNIFNNVNIQSFNVSTNASNFWETTDGLITTDYEFNDSVELDLYVCAESYFCEWFNNTVINESFTASLKQSIINLSVYNLLNVPVSNWSLYNDSTLLLNTTNSSGIAYLPEGNYSNINIKSNDGSFTQQEVTGFVIDALDEKTINFTIVNYLLKVFAKDKLTNATINNYSITVKDLINLFDYNFQTSTGEISEFMLDSVYNITINAENYSLHDNSAIVNVTGDINHTFYLYTDNSVQLIIRNESTGALITQQVNITLTGEQVYTFTTSTGSKYIDNLIPGTYSVKLESAGYSVKYYSVTVGSRSFQTLTTYLINSSEIVTFSLRDVQNEQPLEGVFVSMTKWVNNSWVIVESKLTDIIGKAVFTYTPFTSYRFVAQKTGYSDKTFTLNPITETEYTINMLRVTGEAIIISDVSVSYNPSIFVIGENNFSFTLQSPLGNLINYSISVSYPGGVQDFSGFNAIGEVFEASINIVDPDFFDKVTLNYEYVLSNGVRVTRTLFFSIEGVDTGDKTFIKLVGKTYGLGVVERIILTTIIVLLISGVAFMFAGVGAGLVIGMLLYGFFVITGFIPLWSIIITLLVGFVILAKTGGSQ